MPFKDAKYYHKRLHQPKEFDNSTYVTVPFHHAKYNGEKFKKYHKKGSGALARVAKLKKTGKYAVQVILIPKESHSPLKPAKPLNEFNKAQLEDGTKVEYEHTTSEKVASTIARHHMQEFPKKMNGKIGSDYYIELAKLEKKLDKQKTKKNGK